MTKGYQGDELWTAVNPATGRRDIVDPEGEFIPGETIMKLYYSKRIDGYVTIPGIHFSKWLQTGTRSNPLAKAFPNKRHKQGERCA